MTLEMSQSEIEEFACPVTFTKMRGKPRRLGRG
ncbi:Uncharacterised protein [Oligella ureolytica]|uniref:Uncharacterized protein n=1 Tax=Oligella ureolytica TaxID=90244 RepID=A0A378XJP7_9BURK|nr:Uncharacterised protein [Oligella ureolytica]